MTTKNISTQLVAEALAQAEQAGSVGPADLVIWGGMFAENEGAAFLEVWKTLWTTHLPWRMVEYAGRFIVQQATNEEPALPSPWSALERARLFGPTGDLDLRRDGLHFRWRFIGDKGESWPVVPEQFRTADFDFWQVHADKPPTFRVVECDYYQWRPRDGRVSNKWLANRNANQLDSYLRQRQYLQDGRIAFVRYLDFIQ